MSQINLSNEDEERNSRVNIFLGAYFWKHYFFVSLVRVTRKILTGFNLVMSYLTQTKYRVI